MKKIILPESYHYISAFLTLRCNLNCSFCVNHASSENLQRNSFKEISGEQWVEALNKIEVPQEIPISLVGGEPTLHRDFIYIVNNIKQGLGIDLVTNLWWSEEKVREFIKKISPDRINNHSPFPSIRISYHPEQMKEEKKLIRNAIQLKEAGFDIGIESIMYPSPPQLEAIEKMAIMCKKDNISFRPKSFIGIYEGKDDSGVPFSMIYGDYSKYPESVFGGKKLECLCKTSNLLINPEGNVYRCQRDLLLAENPGGNLLNPDFQVEDSFKSCKNYGQCHPCDVKVKTDNQEQMGTTLVEIKDVKGG